MTLRLFGAFLACHSRGFYGRLSNGLSLSMEIIKKDYRPLFSERNGHRKAYYLGRLRMEVLQ